MFRSALEFGIKAGISQVLHRALCCLFRPDTDGTRVSKCGQLSQQTRRLVQRRWRLANIETALGQMLAFAGLHTGVCLHPPLRHHNILASRSGYF